MDIKINKWSQLLTISLPPSFGFHNAATMNMNTAPLNVSMGGMGIGLTGQTATVTSPSLFDTITWSTSNRFGHGNGGRFATPTTPSFQPNSLLNCHSLSPTSTSSFINQQHVGLRSRGGRTYSLW